MVSVDQYWDGDTSTAYGTAGNWRLVNGDAGAVPLITDTVTFPDGCINPVAGGDFNGVALTSFTINSGYSGTVGSSTNGLVTALQLAATTYKFAGSGISYIDLTANSTTTCDVTGAAASPGTGQFGLALSSADAIATTTIDLTANQAVGIAALAGHTGEFTTISIGGNGIVTLGAGLTTTTVTVGGSGTVYIDCAVTTLTVTGSPTVYLRSGAITTLVVNSGVVYNNTTSTIGTTSIFTGGSVLLTQGPEARVMTTVSVYGDGTFDDSSKKMATCVVKNYGSGVNIRLGSNNTLTRTAIA